jgi:hypothetical protein
VGFDADGNIVGGGYGNQSSIPAGGTVGIFTVFDGSAVPARVEIYPSLMRLSAMPQEAPAASAAQFELEQFGYGVTSKGFKVAYGLLIHNPNAEALRGYANIRFYDQDDVLVEVEEHVYIAGPGKTVGVADDFSITNGSSISRTETAVWVTNWQNNVEVVEFPAEVNAFDRGGGYTRADSLVTNPTASAVEGLLVYAIAFDASGEIIGGARSSVDIAANADVKKDILLSLETVPASIRLYTSKLR